MNQDITERIRAEENLLAIARGVSATTGETFFHSLVAHLVTMLNADYAFIGELVAGTNDRIHTVAVHAHGKHVANFEYALSGTPCQHVVGKITCAYPSGVAQQFPDDRMLVEMGVEAYVGTPLFGVAGQQALGLLVVLYRRPIHDDTIVASTLEIFAARAAAELERVRAETQMRKLSSALEQTADVVIITDRSGVIEYVNLGFEKATGFSRDEAVGQKPSLLKSGKQETEAYKKLWDTILAGNVFSEVLVNRRKDGSLYYEEKTITPLKNVVGEITHFVSTGKDVTERMQVQERLQHMAQHDALTELPNRVLFMDRLKQAMARARWHKRLVAVLFVDMDRFKNINDTLGHEVGDKLLRSLSERFISAVREGDTVARFGGDEFVILLDDLDSEKDIGAVAHKVLEVLAPPFNIDGQRLYVTASIGVSFYPNDGEDSGTLLKNADIAMYRAKDLGKNTYQFYSADMSARAFERLTLESSLRRAIERNEFCLYYQPQIDNASGAILGVEALLRWQHPDIGLVAPAEFVPMLEETGLIVPVGEWVFRTACDQLRVWHAAGWPTLRMAVNLSPRQLQTIDLPIMVERGVATVGCDPALIELEITENVLLRHTPTTIDTLDALRSLGVRLAIDDFGTGYSSLSYLRRYSIDTLKIDRSFVRDVPDDVDDSALAAAIIVLTQSLNLDVIAEGVETEAQREFLRVRGCQVMQGNLFSRPVPAADIPPMLELRNKGD